MANLKYRIRLPGKTGTPAISISVGEKASVGQYYTDIWPAIDFCITDDIMHVSDPCSFTVPNPDGVNTGKIAVGRRVEIDASESGVASGQWTRIYTGVVTNVHYGSRLGVGTTIRIDCMDLGWFLTTCCARPLQTTNHVTLDTLITNLIETESTWGLAATTATVDNNAFNTQLKQGRAGAQRAQKANPKAVLPPIQVEPGQTPWQVLELYCKRAGLLLNVGAMGNLILFRPNYTQASHYHAIHYHPSDVGLETMNNVLDVAMTEAIEGVWSEAQCWSTVVNPTKPQSDAIALHPNMQYLNTTVTNPNLLGSVPFTNAPAFGSGPPFNRRIIVVDSEAINEAMRHSRALWAAQMAEFNSWTYEVTVAGHSSSLSPQSHNAGVFFASDTLISVNDSIHGVNEMLYVQAVQKQFTEDGGSRTKLTLRKKGIFNPELLAQTDGAD